MWNSGIGSTDWLKGASEQDSRKHMINGQGTPLYTRGIKIAVH